MKKKRYSEEQIVRILREGERGDKTIGEIARLYGISENTFYNWRKRYGGMSVPDVRRLRELEKENARLKRIVAERDLEIDAMKEVLSKSGDRSPAPGGGGDVQVKRPVRAPFMFPCLNKAEFIQVRRTSQVRSFKLDKT